MEVTVVRFERYPAELPTGYVVGFDVRYNGRSRYMDQIVTFQRVSDSAAQQDDASIVRMAWEDLSDQVKAWMATASSVNPIIGMVIDVAPPEESLP